MYTKCQEIELNLKTKTKKTGVVSLDYDIVFNIIDQLVLDTSFIIA